MLILVSHFEISKKWNEKKVCIFVTSKKYSFCKLIFVLKKLFKNKVFDYYWDSVIHPIFKERQIRFCLWFQNRDDF
jgi:hypothetical protein